MSDKELVVAKVLGKDNPAYLMTKGFPKNEIVLHLQKLGYA